MNHPRLAAVLISGGLLMPMAALGQAPAATSSATKTEKAEEENLVRPYGVVNTRVIVASRAVESFSQPNTVAITAAGNPVIANEPDHARYSFQAAQTRAGLWVNEKGRLRGRVEIDFVDFTKATPTVASMPRLRIAIAEYAFSPGHSIALGQDWDLHSPLNTPSINMVGTLFQAGNTGFMRQQLRYLYSGTDVELGAALGFPAPNNTAKDSTLEINSIPTLALRGAYKIGKGKVGVSAIATSFPFGRGTDQERHGFAFSTVLFADLFPTANTNVRAEFNFGQDSANLGLLSLAQGQTAGDVRELGGWASVRQSLATEHAVYLIVGTEHVLNPDDLAPSYAYPPSPPGGAPPAINTSALAGTGPGIRDNTAVRIGYEFKPITTTAIVLEGFGYRTNYQLQAVDVGRVNSVRHAYGVETGFLLSF
ncbi:hypothetical protein P2318_09785 [Myxococcaceae bacterium GXIMD 01537]